MGDPIVELRPMDDETLEAVLAVAVADADPEEVMPAVQGPPGWTQNRQDAFRAFHRERWAGLRGPCREIGFAIACDGALVGVARLARRDDERLETGAWIARSARGRGVGAAVLPLLLWEASRLGASELLADTTAGNAAALNILRRYQARFAPGRSGTVHASLPVPHGSDEP